MFLFDLLEGQFLMNDDCLVKEHSRTSSGKEIMYQLLISSCTNLYYSVTQLDKIWIQLLG